jgi:hypothetical protein
MSSKEEQYTIFKEAKKQVLSQEEKNVMRLELLQFIKSNPVNEAARSTIAHNHTYWYSSFTRLSVTSISSRYAILAAILVILFFSGVGVSLAASNALPLKPA